MERTSSLLLIVLLFVAGCKSSENLAMKQGKASRLMLPDHAAAQYRLLTSADPYQVGNIIVWDQQSPACILMRPDGSFLETHGVSVSEGHWYLNRPHTFMAMSYQTQYDQPASPQSQEMEFRIRLDEYGGDTLRLAKQGRHGWVVYTYLKDPKEVIN